MVLIKRAKAGRFAYYIQTINDGIERGTVSLSSKHNYWKGYHAAHHNLINLILLPAVLLEGL